MTEQFVTDIAVFFPKYRNRRVLILLELRPSDAMCRHGVNVAAVAGHTAGAYAVRSRCKQVRETGDRVKRRDRVGTVQRRGGLSARHCSSSLFSVMVSQRQLWKYTIALSQLKTRSFGYLFCALCIQHTSPLSQLLNN